MPALSKIAAATSAPEAPEDAGISLNRLYTDFTRYMAQRESAVVLAKSIKMNMACEMVRLSMDSARFEGGNCLAEIA